MRIFGSEFAMLFEGINEDAALESFEFRLTKD